jgi:hypothetical protein
MSDDTMFPFGAFKIDPSLPPGTIKIRAANGSELFLTNLAESEITANPEETVPENLPDLRWRAEHPCTPVVWAVEEEVAYACWRFFYRTVENMDLAQARVRKERTAEALKVMGVRFDVSEEGRRRAQEEQQRQSFRRRERDG